MKRSVPPFPHTSAHASQNVIYLTVNLPDIQDTSLVCDLKADSIDFKAKAGEKDYAFTLDFFEEIDPEVRQSPRSMPLSDKPSSSPNANSPLAPLI